MKGIPPEEQCQCPRVSFVTRRDVSKQREINLALVNQTTDKIPIDLDINFAA